jgi:HPt (histidine-containing phosphotransfer) domain-containing protein
VLRRWTGATERMTTLNLTAPAGTVAEDVSAYAPTPIETAGLIDPEILEQLRQLGGSDFAAQLYADFEGEAGQLLAEAQALVQAGQYEQILPHLHQLKGTGFTLGINPLAECAKQLEHDLKEGQTHRAEANFQDLLRYFAQFTAVYPSVTSAP